MARLFLLLSRKIPASGISFRRPIPGGVGAERAAAGPLAVGESRAADFSWEWLSAFVVAGAAEPILSKRLQGCKANVVNVASSTAAESVPLWASGAAGRK